MINEVLSIRYFTVKNIYTSVLVRVNKMVRDYTANFKKWQLFISRLKIAVSLRRRITVGPEMEKVRSASLAHVLETDKVWTVDAVGGGT